MCEIFQIILNFKEIIIENIDHQNESQEVILSLEFLGNNAISTNNDESSIMLFDGSYPIHQTFIFSPENFIENEDFAFQAFENLIKGIK